MIRFLGSRLMYTLLLLLVISLVVFVATAVLPGNVATMILGTDATRENVVMLERQLGLDRPSHERYLGWLAGMLRGDFGRSLRMRQPVAPILRTRLLNSLVLAGAAFSIIVVVGLGLGVLTGVYEGSRFDRVTSVLSVVGTSLPEFVSGTILVILFAGSVWTVLPSSGYTAISEGLIPWARHLVMPAATLAFVLTAYVARMARVSVIEALRSDYVRTARLKGLAERAVVVRHVLPNALLPAVTVLFMNLGWLFGGIVVVEEVFVFPGIGRLMLFAITQRDWPLIQACALVIASIYVLGNLVADLLQVLLSPRLREEQVG